MGTRETRKQQHTATTLLRAPEKKYDLLKEKKAAFGGKKGAVLTAGSRGKSKTEIAIFWTLLFFFFISLKCDHCHYIVYIDYFKNGIGK